jgi:hypothetical protein
MAPTLTLLPPEDEDEEEDDDDDVREGESGDAAAVEALRVLAVGVVAAPELIKEPASISGLTGKP